MSMEVAILEITETSRVAELRRRTLAAMRREPVDWPCPERIDEPFMSDPLAVRKARAMALKLSRMPTDLWNGQLLAGSMALEAPRVHAERGFPDYTTETECADAAERGLSIRSIFGHIVPNYPTLLAKGLRGIRTDTEAQRPQAGGPDETAFLDSVIIALDAVIDYAARLAIRCLEEAEATTDRRRSEELIRMAANCQQVPAGPAKTFRQGLQSVWLLHMVFHSTMNGNALGRVDQYLWPLLKADLEAGRLDLNAAAELVDCFWLKCNERTKNTEDQRPESRDHEPADPGRRSRHYTSSQIGTDRDRIDATNHWLQNVIIGGLTPGGHDGTNPLTYLILDSCRRMQMTNPVLTVRLHRDTPDELVQRVCEVLKAGGGMPALFNDETLVPAIEHIGIPAADARDYTNDGCWETIIPGRTDFRFQRLSVMLCLEWALSRGRSRMDGGSAGIDTGDPRSFTTFDHLWLAFLKQLDAMVGRVVRRTVETVDDRSTIAPVPLLSALIDGAVSSRRDMTAGGARFRTFALLAEGAAHAIDSLVAIKMVIFGRQQATMAQLCDAMDGNFEGHETLRGRLLAAPKYGNDDDRADAVGRQMIDAFVETVNRHAETHRSLIKFPCGVATFSWYIGIGEGLGASADGRLRGRPVSSNFSPALGRDVEGLPGAILSYAKMDHGNLPTGGPLDLRLARRLVLGQEGTARMVALLRSFVDTGGSMMTLTVADTEELRAAQREPDKYESLRVRMGGWCAYFTALSREQQDHHIHRQEARS